ncbi:hypothetical protein FHX08_001109 [Rhizobium sp. BK529]|uniref:DUF1236 domain-containing protein n=1 Tax=unclassified Rhizobium TaxID=2613769 RepID=UPI00104CA29A|nr:MULTISPECIES: DUF1236 domain-containing protein [unclassified Rhizobium]MBB3590765.1 hypothetical protein [Rhizobium sp. BK529]TCS09278.1 uncharacterized protein DUF1236 [Rhizobium sp. BK418]
MKTTHLTMMLAALSISVSPLAAFPTSAQQNMQGGGQPQSDPGQSQSGQPQSGTTACPTPDASGGCPTPEKGKQVQQNSGKGTEMQQNAQQPPKTNPSAGGTITGQASGETTIKKPGSQQNSGSSMTQQKSTTQPSGETTGSTTTKNQTSNTTANVNITTEQQTEIRQSLKDVHVAPVKETDFDIAVGTAVPKKVHLATLPARIVKIVPEYKGYRYFVLADGRIVIVDPSSLQIVYIIAA